MDGVDVVALGQGHDLVLGQVGGHRIQPLAHQIGLVRLVTMQVNAILFGKDGDRSDPELRASPEHAHGDLSTVGAQHPAEDKLAHRRQIWSDEATRVNGRTPGRPGPAQPARNWKSRSRTTSGS